MKLGRLNIITIMLLIVSVIIFSCKKDDNSNNDCSNANAGGKTISKQFTFSGTVKDSCTNQPLSNVLITIFAYGDFTFIGHDCMPMGDEYGVEILNTRTDANGKFSANKTFTLNGVSSLWFYQVNINGYYLYHATSDPYIYSDNNWLSTIYYRVKDVDSLQPKTFVIRAFPKVYFTNCKTLYSDSSKYQFLELYPLRNKKLFTVGNNVDLGTQDGIHWKATYGDTIQSAPGLIPNNWYGYQYWKKVGSAVTQFNDSIFINCTSTYWINL